MSEIIERVKKSLIEGLKMIDQIAINNNIEIWKPIDGYLNYQVSSLGNVKNITTQKALHGSNDKDGYIKISLVSDGIKRYFRLHRLVAIAFLKNCDNKPLVDHINQDVKDNSVKNLRWASLCENMRNTKICKSNTSGVKGVTFDKNRWCARIRYNGRKLHIGSYKTLEEAKEARQKKAKELFKDYVNSCEV